MVMRYDRVAIKATRTDEGFIRDTPVLTRTGVFLYKQKDGTVRRELRLPEHVFKADSLKTLHGIPVTNGHPGKVTKDNASANIGSVLSEGRQDGENLVADVVIHDTKTVDAGNKELSCGYECELIEKQGTWNGEKYDAIQTDIRHNHLAVVSKGRAGTARLNLDAADAVYINEKEVTMPKIRLDSGIEYEAAEEVIQSHAKLKQDVSDAVAECDKEKARADKAEADLKKKESEIEQIKQDSQKQARKRVELEATAKLHGVEVKQDMKDVEIKSAVVMSLRQDTDLSGKSDDYVSAMFDLAIADAEKGKKAVKTQREDMAVSDDKSTSAAAAREKMINGGE